MGSLQLYRQHWPNHLLQITQPMPQKDQTFMATRLTVRLKYYYFSGTALETFITFI